MLTVISRTHNDSSFIGTQHPPLDKVIGGETVYLQGTSAGQYLVPANTKCTLKSLVMAIRTGLIGQASRSSEVAGILNCGVVTANIGATVLNEFRIQESTLPNVVGADELVVPFMNMNQSPSIGEGIICPAGTAFTIKVTPAQTTNLVWTMTVFGKRGTTADIQGGTYLTATTTADQTLLSYTPAADWTIMSIFVDAEAPGQLAGQATIQMDGQQILETPYLGCGESTSNMFDLDSFAGVGTGALILPLWNIELYPGESIGFTPIPFIGDKSTWGLTIAGTESTLSTGTAGATSFAY